uniref:COX assembly mitochondrial protein n=1 Tax=Chlamydomonas chlamydogama TaxID=225041 RepID=A0A7S2QTL9_9CHLO|eukprot:CAMPEP_0202892150 /NCGR_PEP_ID=MMETSP1392-20130828/1955_1 /ASSEMBLY_ACC=CAM_ASM_000868 /TAXON_ID=225041 /ORGANISM="Chlamydomonas chlamydogama, Strain SAG 11-48b" /LENGTH=125 /DNA_ID=CAMNT_0049576033 /DNA_START=61 /DNA_END=438 /DNA_ORIENTATION=+
MSNPKNDPNDTDDVYNRDRSRFYRDPVDPYTEGIFNRGFVSSRQEAYDKCATQVVSLLKCVDEKGPMWFFSCGQQYVELQKCYEVHKQQPGWGVVELYKTIKQTATIQYDYMRWWWRDMFGDRKD